MVEKVIRVGTRGSLLARWQAAQVVQALQEANPGWDVREVIIHTEGDRVQDRPISQFADKGVFIRAIEQALLAGEIDLAVHSLKDVPSDRLTPGLILAAFPQRADPRDALVSARGGLYELPVGARIGTSSARRRVQLNTVRPDVHACDIRGNVDTRLRRVEEGQYDGVILAAAGLLRLGLERRITEYLSVELFTPDAGQGILAVQGRVGDEITHLAARLDVPRLRLQAEAERRVVATLGADCHSPVGALVQLAENHVTLRAMAASAGGDQVWRVWRQTNDEQVLAVAGAVGITLARLLGERPHYTEG